MTAATWMSRYIYSTLAFSLAVKASLTKVGPGINQACGLSFMQTSARMQQAVNAGDPENDRGNEGSTIHSFSNSLEGDWDLIHAEPFNTPNGGPQPPVSVQCKDQTKWFASHMVVVNNGDKKLLYCPVPKVASSTTFAVLAHMTHHQGRAGAGWQKVYDFIKDGRSKELCDMYSFVIIRNPWDRLYSAYADKIVGPYITGGEDYRPFPKFAKAVGKQNPEYANIHWMQLSRFCNLVGGNATHYSDVLKLEESIEDHIAKAMTHIGFTAELTHAAYLEVGEKNAIHDSNMTHEELRHKVYDNRTMNIVRRNFANDIKLGHYKF